MRGVPLYSTRLMFYRELQWNLSTRDTLGLKVGRPYLRGSLIGGSTVFYSTQLYSYSLCIYIYITVCCSPGNYLSRQVSRWSAQYTASETHTIPAMDSLMKWLNSTQLPPGRTTVVHGDYRHVVPTVPLLLALSPLVFSAILIFQYSGTSE